MVKSRDKAVGVDIGGTGVKAALVDVQRGELLSDRVKVPTPAGGEPDAIRDAVVELVSRLEIDDDTPIGVTFPAIVRRGRTMSAANVSKAWIGLEAESLFERALGRDIHFVNDADAAGFAEDHYGAAKDAAGLVIMTTLGTGIGGALIYNGVLIPNAELGHLELDGHDAESRASNRVREARGSAGRRGPRACSATTATWSSSSRPTCSSWAAACRSRPTSSCRCSSCRRRSSPRCCATTPGSSEPRRSRAASDRIR